MSEIEVTHGGVIAVDTGVLRALLLRLWDAADRFSEAASRLGAASREFGAISGGSERVWTLGALRRELSGHGDRLHATAARLRLMIDAYEIVEGRARAETLRLTGALEEWDQVQGELAEREAANPHAGELADSLIAGWRGNRHAAFAAQAWGLLPVSALAAASAWAMLYGTAVSLGSSSFGHVVPGSALAGPAPSARVYGSPAKDPVAAPKSLADLVSRIPVGEGQIRVERLEFADGSEEYLVHIAGTREFLGDNPFNMTSNLELYFREASASASAVQQALAQSGASPGAVIHTNGHSQGAMIGTHLAVSGEYEVRSAFGIGNPARATYPDSVLSVEISHQDDLVPLLAGRGTGAGTGSVGSILIERTGDPLPGLQDLKVATHHVSTYVETAAMFDRSGDPRVAELERLWAHLARATKVTATDYIATTEEPGGSSRASDR